MEKRISTIGENYFKGGKPMASNHTQHYGLCQWEATDAVLRTDFNEDNQKIDTALKTQASNISDLTAQMANKANTGAVNSLAEEVAQKADQSDLEATVSRVTTLENKHSSDVAALRSENCWIKLSEETISSAAESYSYFIENPEQYVELKCIYSMQASSGGLSVSINDGALLYEHTSHSGKPLVDVTGSLSQGIGGKIHVFPLGNTPNVILQCSCAGFNDDSTFYNVEKWMGTKEISFERLQKISICDSGGAFQAGGRFILYGLKK